MERKLNAGGDGLPADVAGRKPPLPQGGPQAFRNLHREHADGLDLAGNAVLVDEEPELDGRVFIGSRNCGRRHDLDRHGHDFERMLARGRGAHGRRDALDGKRRAEEKERR